ncbi:MAG: DUF3817 domain-containing protein [Candidatus Saccharimonadales bacterium]
MRQKFNEKRNNLRFFTENEAWNLFRLAAFGEAIGWTLLISGILFQHFFTPHSNIPVQIVGQVHGTLFILYIVCVIIVHQSLDWNFSKTLFAGLISIPPYGTLAYEQWLAHLRNQKERQTQLKIYARAIIWQGNELLLVQPKDSLSWELPGGLVNDKKEITSSLDRSLNELFGIRSTVGKLRYVWRHSSKNHQNLELFYEITNPKDFISLALKEPTGSARRYDEVMYINPKLCEEINPNYLRKITPKYKNNELELIEE